MSNKYLDINYNNSKYLKYKAKYLALKNPQIDEKCLYSLYGGNSYEYKSSLIDTQNGGAKKKHNIGGGIKKNIYLHQNLLMKVILINYVTK